MEMRTRFAIAMIAGMGVGILETHAQSAATVHSFLWHAAYLGALGSFRKVPPPLRKTGGAFRTLLI